MDEHKICFIMCCNNEMYMEECLFYIHRLEVPAGYTVEALTIWDAASMTAGYNEGMQSSDAKYKVYLHQDTFLVDRHFLTKLLEVFRQDSRIGIVGAIGAPKLSHTGVMWNVDRWGMLYEQHIYETVKLYNYPEHSPQLLDVEVMDGFLLATQYDLPWREELFDKWDFYDCSQCKEFARRGYRVVVPYLEEPWAVHDAGFVDLHNYEGERQKFVREYFGEN